MHIIISFFSFFSQCRPKWYLHHTESVALVVNVFTKIYNIEPLDNVVANIQSGHFKVNKEHMTI